MVPFEHPIQGSIQIPAYPISFSESYAGTRSMGPSLGEHTDSVLNELGYSDQDIENFKQEGIVK
jgi:crotonobetainyl-CoA:carnitine CoA-transferase CaiB-like acyl-CoA transferase